MRLFFLFVMNVAFINLFAGDNEPEMADALRADGKIWVVIAVALIILAGLITYLVMLDRRLRKIEKEKKSP